MVPEEKRAMFILAVVGLSVITVVVLVPFLRARALGGFCLLGLTSLTPLLFRKGEAKPDERDVAIGQKATMLGGLASLLAFVAATVGPLVYFVVVGAETVPLHDLGLVVLAGALAFMVTRSITVLILYHRGAGDAQD